MRMSESKQEWNLPKNIRQIGDGSGEKKIYVEDYVVTYLNQLAEEGKEKRAILLGSVREKNLYPYIFVDGALSVESFYMEERKREEFAAARKTYFEEKQIVGWFLAAEESPFIMNKEITEVYKREFSGENQILLVKDELDPELQVFLMEEEIPVEQPGFYIYYERNKAMQNYMITRNHGKSVDDETNVKDDAIKNVRQIIKNKKLPLKKIKWKPGKVSYPAAGFLAMTVLALGVTVGYNYDRMKAVERSLARLTDNVDSQIEYVTDDPKEELPVMLHMEEGIFSDEETMSGEVTTEDITEETEMETGERKADSEEETESDPTRQTSGMARASYLIKVGDTLAGISQMYYGTSDMVKEICSLNGISDEDTILPGQKILLP